MTSSTLGAPLGGTTRGAQYGVDSAALRSIFPPNGVGGAGNCWPESGFVAPGDPAGGVGCCAFAPMADMNSATAVNKARARSDIGDLSLAKSRNRSGVS